MCLGIPGKIEEISGEGLTLSGVVSFEGVCRDVSLALLPTANVGDYVLVHAGYALQTIDEEEARSVLALLRQMEPESLPSD